MSYSGVLQGPAVPTAPWRVPGTGARGRPRLADVTAASPGIREELLLRARGCGLATGWIALLVLPAWAVADRLLAPAPAASGLASGLVVGLVVGLVAEVSIGLCVWALARRPIGRRRPEALTFLLLAVVQIVSAWMLPRVPDPDYHLLGSLLVLLVSGSLLALRPRFTGALVATTGIALALALLTAPAPPATGGVVRVAVWFAAVSLIAQVAHARRHELEVRGLLGRLELANEQEHGRTLLARTPSPGGQDPLTGLANRRQWDAALTQACQAAREHGESVSVILLDLDHLGVLNDRHGHPGGDEVLRQVATLLSGGVRGSDLVARLGGDEMAVLLPGAPPDQAVLRAERLREAVELLLLPGFWAGEITASFGVAGATGEQAFPVELMSCANQQLYRAKIGRNRVGALDDLGPLPESWTAAGAEHPVC